MSHKLHTPLTGILGATILLATTSLTPEQEEYLSFVVSSAEQLKSAVSDVLACKKAESIVEKQPVSIKECLDEALQLSAITSGVNCHVANDIPEFILSDRGCIVRVLLNMILNAVRFTHQDPVDITIEKTEPATHLPSNHSDTGPNTTYTTDNDKTTYKTIDNTDTNTNTTTTTDTTPNTATNTDANTCVNVAANPDYNLQHNTASLPVILRVTVRNSSTDTAQSFRFDNSLSETKHLVELLGGEINISDGIYNRPSITFTIKADAWIPPTHPPQELSPQQLGILPPTSSSLSAPPSPNSLPVSPSGISMLNANLNLSGLDKEIKVLLVEDNLMNQKVIWRLFSKLGVMPDLASHGGEAVEYVRKKKYDIVFMDLHMPVCDGFEATKQILGLPDHHHKPHIYALTASVSGRDKEECMKVGMRGHLLKPVSMQALADVLCSVRAG